MEDLDKSYQGAREAGVAGADCFKLFADCPEGLNWLDTYLDYF